MGLIAPRAAFLTHAVPGIGEEDIRQPQIYAAAGEPKAMWRVPGSDHTGGFEAQPAEYERRVIAFLDDALRGRNDILDARCPSVRSRGRERGRGAALADPD